jgi:tetratricopeptide (TPR) repeat protein
MRQPSPMPLFLVLSLLLSGGSPGRAQSNLGAAGKPNTQDAREQKGEQARSAEAQRNEAQLAQKKDALKRMELLIGQVAKIDDATTRAQVEAQFANELWSRDEARARKLFQKAYDDSILIPAPTERDGFLLTPSCGSVRSKIVQSLMSHDPEFAYRLVIDSSSQTACYFGPKEQNAYESMHAVLLVQIASALVSKNPVAAANLARQSLQEGIVFLIPDLLTRLEAVDAKLSASLLNAAVDRIAEEDVYPLEILTMSSYFFEDNPSQQSNGGTEKKSRAEEKRAVAIRFLNATLSASNRFVSKLEQISESKDQRSNAFDPLGSTGGLSLDDWASSLYQSLTESLPAFEHYDRERLAEANALVERASRLMDPISRKHFLIFYDNGDTPEGLVAEAEASNDPAAKDELFQLGAELAIQKQKYDLAQAIASRINKLEKRNETLDSVWTELVSNALQAQRYQEIEGLVERISLPERQVMELLMVATQLQQSGHKTQAIEFLDKTAASLRQIGSTPAPEQAEVWMELARVYTRADIARGFENMKTAIEIINAVKDMPVDQKMRRRYGRPVTLTDPLSLYGSDLSAFKTLAQSDYVQALNLAQRFHDPALSITAQFAVVQVRLSH